MIRLTQNESRLFKFLLYAAQHGGHKDTVLRVAGGWVRDKLLDKHSTDIDIALNDMHGTAFAHCAERALPSYQQLYPDEASSSSMGRHIATIAANPDKSKHLETATVRMFDFSVDFVNLRAEDYAADSRIPTMHFGTPEQDALRRDLTINALFYNITDDKVEDFTGKGLSDLQEGVIRTPLEPRTTFIDDPLRVLRAIRFGSRFNYRFDDDLVRAARLPDVKEALLSKVSRERVGQELYGIFNQAPQPLLALHTAAQWSVFDVMFRTNLWNPARIAFALAAGERAALAHDATARGTPQPPSLIVAALLSPLAGQKAPVVKKPPPLVTHIVADSLKWSHRDAVNVQTTLDGALVLRTTLLTHGGIASPTDATLQRLFTVVDDSLDAAGDELYAVRAARVAFGKVLRDAGELWRDVVCLALALDDLIGVGQPLLAADGVANLSLVDQVGARASATAAVTSSADRFVRLEQTIRLLRDQLRLEDVWSLKPLLDGHQLQLVVNMPAGQWLNTYRERLLERQIANPAMTEDDARRFITLLHQQQQQQKKQ